jgi:phospholipid-binding lipoprotein MlaA
MFTPISNRVGWLAPAAALGVFLLAVPVFADSSGANDPTKPDDPLEPINRVTSDFNAFLRKTVLDPLVDGYKAVTPDEMQKAISNIFSNLSEPVTVGSSLLQGDVDNAGVATQRFLINTTAGLGGIGDPASEQGLKQRKEDLGQAFGAHGAAPGPHIVLPVFGPSNLRDATGDVIIGVINPAPLALKAADAGVGYADKKDTIKSISDGALDRYTVERNAYEQYRQYQVDNGRGPALAFPDINAEEKETVAETKSPTAR